MKMARRRMRQFHVFLVDHRWLTFENPNGRIPSIRDMLFGGTVITLASIVMFLIGLDLMSEGGGFANGLLTFLAGCFLWLVALAQIAVFVFALRNRWLMKRRLRTVDQPRE